MDGLPSDILIERFAINILLEEKQRKKNLKKRKKESMDFRWLTIPSFRRSSFFMTNQWQDHKNQSEEMTDLILFYLSLFISLSIYLSVCLFVCLFVSFFLCFFVCLFLSLFLPFFFFVSLFLSFLFKFQNLPNNRYWWNVPYQIWHLFQMCHRPQICNLRRDFLPEDFVIKDGEKVVEVDDDMSEERKEDKTQS